MRAFLGHESGWHFSKRAQVVIRLQTVSIYSLALIAAQAGNLTYPNSKCFHSLVSKNFLFFTEVQNTSCGYHWISSFIIVYLARLLLEILNGRPLFWKVLNLAIIGLLGARKVHMGAILVANLHTEYIGIYPSDTSHNFSRCSSVIFCRTKARFLHHQGRGSRVVGNQLSLLNLLFPHPQLSFEHLELFW